MGQRRFVRSWANRLFWSLLAVVIAQAWWRYGGLPPRVATHFDLHGQPNGWMSREAHTIAQIGLALGLAAFMQALVWLIPRLPVAFINVPYREYWFAPERRAASLSWLRETILWLGCGLFVMLGLLFDEVYRANLRATPMLGAALWPVNATLVLVIGGIAVATFRRFRRPPEL